MICRAPTHGGVADVYEALVSNRAAWEQTLLVVT
jgi:hypothetical protein